MQKLVLEADLSHPKYLLGSCCIPTSERVSPATAQQSWEAPMAWDPDGIGKPQISVILHWFLSLPGSGEKKTKPHISFFCVQN